MILLGFSVIPSNQEFIRRPSKNPITEKEYYEQYTDELKHIPCPVCHANSSLFAGSFWINCRNCDNLYLTPKELVNRLVGDVL